SLAHGQATASPQSRQQEAQSPPRSAETVTRTKNEKGKTAQNGGRKRSPPSFHPRIAFRFSFFLFSSFVAFMYVALTETLARVIANAQAEARRLNQDFIGTEHLAMALLDLDESEAGRVLAQMNVESGYVRNALAHA